MNSRLKSINFAQDNQYFALIEEIYLYILYVSIIDIIDIILLSFIN